MLYYITLCYAISYYVTVVVGCITLCYAAGGSLGVVVVPRAGESPKFGDKPGGFNSY